MNQKIIYSLIAAIFVWIIAFTTYTHLGIEDFNVEKIETEVLNKKLTIDTVVIQEENSEKYDYYQLYMYPETYTLDCSGNSGVCSSITSHEERLKQYTLKFIGKDLKVSSADDIVFDFNFSNYKIQKHLLTSMFEDLFVRENNVENPKTIAQEICEETVRSSFPWWWDDDEFLQEQIDMECVWTDIQWDVQFAFGWGEQWGEENNNPKLKVSIDTMRMVYKFFNKVDWKYIEREVQEKIVENPLVLEATIDLSDF